MRQITDNRRLFPLDGAGVDAGETADRLLHICPACRSSLVQPTCWEQQEDRTRWRLWRRCPECEWTCDEVHEEAEIDVFDEQLDFGAHELVNELRALEHANMAEMADVFIIALTIDLISADDFA
jgi:hypothetical protein